MIPSFGWGDNLNIIMTMRSHGKYMLSFHVLIGDENSWIKRNAVI